MRKSRGNFAYIGVYGEQRRELLYSPFSVVHPYHIRNINSLTTKDRVLITSTNSDRGAADTEPKPSACHSKIRQRKNSSQLDT